MIVPAIPRLHVVTNEWIAQLPRLRETAQAVARGAAVALHARVRGGRALTALADELAWAVRGTASCLVVSDRAEIALLSAARGLHLPANGLPVDAARQLMGPTVMIGRSAHDPREARAASAAGADYVFLGPIWETSSHPGRRPLGAAAIAAAAPARVIAIGGVTRERVPQCAAAGAFGVAAVSAIWNAPDPDTAAADMLLSFMQHSAG